MNITILSIYSQRLNKFENAVRDIFDFFEPFWTQNFFHYSMRFIITRKPRDGFGSNFLRMIMNMLHIYYKYAAEFEIVVWDIFDFSETFLTQNFPLMHGLPDNSETMKWILLNLSGSDYQYAAHTLALMHSRTRTYSLSHALTLALTLKHLHCHEITLEHTRILTRTCT